jgi:3-oxoacyl-ACP reductase-like protein
MKCFFEIGDRFIFLVGMIDTPLKSKRRNRMAASIFKDKVVVITGASSGIGRELAYQLAEQGAWLSLAARNGERLATVVALCAS